jgi:tetratricopeptide (TPR) repeat protein/class 3 adenylate cyclase
VKNLIPHFIQEQYRLQKPKGQLQAFTMSVDLSGFTPLTESLMAEGNRGAERLSVILNDIFAPLVSLVYARGGFIPYFAGDSFIAVFPARQSTLSPTEIVQVAQQARHFFSARGFQFGDFPIGIKIGLSWGRVEWGIVGQQFKSFYMRGAPIDSCAECQTRAGNEEIVIDEALRQVLQASPIDMETIAPHYYRITTQVGADTLTMKPKMVAPIAPEVAGIFLPEAVLEFNGDGEFRSVVSVFISFDGVDSHEELDEFANLVLEHIHAFAGYFKEIEFGDKGGVMVGFFGAPVSFENNADRALEFICALREALAPLQMKSDLRIRTGMTLGTAYTGIVGGQERCQYAAVGNRVNLAARLMTYADWGDTLVDLELAKSKYFSFLHKGDIKYKGIKGSVPTFKLAGRNFEMPSTFTGQLVGREEELKRLLEFAAPLPIGQPPGVTYIYGEAGIGKSRLTYELRKQLCQQDRVVWFICQTDQILHKPFNPFIYFLRNYFEQSPDGSISANQTLFENRFQRIFEKVSSLSHWQEADFISKELQRTKPVLAALLGILYKDSIWDQLDAKGRYQNTIQSILTLIIAESLVQPIVLQLEDAHWLDDNSRELLHELSRYLPRYPIWLLITSRLRDDGQKPNVLEGAPINTAQTPHLEINLNMLAPQAVRQFAEIYLQGPISQEFYELLLRTTNSNPFYLEQVLEYFAESNLLDRAGEAWSIKDNNIRLSGSINAILTARIDRLSSLVKETIKAAAVIGREFEVPVLTEVMKGQEEFTKRNGNAGVLLREQIQAAERVQIWHAMNELRYIFRHSLLREAVYSMQLRARLQQLHQLIAEAIERLYAERLDERYFDLAFHYEQAGVEDKTCEYLRKAADYARHNYQNQLALEYYERLLQKIASHEDIERQVKIHLQQGRVLELVGQWGACEHAYAKALKLAKKTRDVGLLAQSHNSIGRLKVLRGDYVAAAPHLQTAEQLFELLDDQAGISRVYGNLGNLYFRQGDYEQAKACFKRSIDLSRVGGAVPNSQIVAHLGLTYMNQGNYDEAIQCQQAQLELAKTIGDKQGMADLHTKVGIVFFEKGDYDAALRHYEKGLELSRELGNKQLMAIAIGCIGSVYERKGDYVQAMAHFEQDLELCEEIGDKQGIAIALGLIGELLSYKGEFYRAIEYLQKDLMICEELGYQKGVAKAVNTLADIFYYLGEYNRALQYYDRAINITRKIGNKLVLGFSLIEKGAVLIETGDLQALEAVTSEALALAETLGNPDLQFEAQLISARHYMADQNTERAKAILQQLQQYARTPARQATIYAELFRLQPNDTQLRARALQLYEEAYAATPRYSFKKQIELLQQL